MKKTSQVDVRTLPRDRPWLDSRPVYDEAAANREYKRRVKESRTEEEHEFQRIQNLIIKRNSRAKRTTERKEEDKAKANEGMKKIKEGQRERERNICGGNTGTKEAVTRIF